MSVTETPTPEASIYDLACAQAEAASTREQREAAALALYDLGVPSLNPDEPMRALTSAHRWGRHGERPDPRCPVCKRREGAQA